jgi:hypothetical protein
MAYDLLAAKHAEPEKWSTIGQFTAVLTQAADLLPYIAEEENGGNHAKWVAYCNSLTTDLRALYGFMLGPRNERDAHRTDFVQKWTPSKSDARRRLDKFIDFIHVHRAHFSRKRFADLYPAIEDWVPAEYLERGRITAKGYAQALTDYLDVVDEFIQRLPPDSLEQRAFRGASSAARYKINEFLGTEPQV